MKRRMHVQIGLHRHYINMFHTWILVFRVLSACQMDDV